MRITSKQGKRSVKLEVKERKLLVNAAVLCAELAELSTGTMSHRADQAAIALESVVDRIDGKHDEPGVPESDESKSDSHDNAEPPASAPIPAVARKTGPACQECGRPLSKGELRQEREKCFFCDPI